MRKLYATLIMLTILFFLHGCVFIADDLDYQNDLSDYEVKKIVRTVFLSQHSLADAALLTTDGYSMIYDESGFDASPQRYSCHDGGYIRLELDQNGYALTFSTGDVIHLAYDDCSYDTYYKQPGQLSGPLEITWYQDIRNSHNRLIELGIHYEDSYLRTPYATLYLRGRIGLHYDEDSDTDMLKLILSSNELHIHRSDTSDDDTYENIVLDFSMNRYSLAYHYSYSGTLYNDYLGRLSFSTLSPMQGYADKNPRGGEFKISNAYMTLRILPVDDYYVDIVVRNSCDTYQNRTIHTTWLNIGL